MVVVVVIVWVILVSLMFFLERLIFGVMAASFCTIQPLSKQWRNANHFKFLVMIPYWCFMNRMSQNAGHQVLI